MGSWGLALDFLRPTLKGFSPGWQGSGYRPPAWRWNPLPLTSPGLPSNFCSQKGVVMQWSLRTPNLRKRVWVITDISDMGVHVLLQSLSILGVTVDKQTHISFYTSSQDLNFVFIAVMAENDASHIYVFGKGSNTFITSVTKTVCSTATVSQNGQGVCSWNLIFTIGWTASVLLFHSNGKMI